MSGLNRAYRDTKSPLQPLTPLSVNADFSFNIGGDGSLQPWIEQINIQRGKLHSKPNPERKQVQALVQCQAPAPLRKKPNPVVVERDKRTPVLKTNSRMYNVLARVGMDKYWEFFLKRGIDFGKFQKLTSKDFESLGIRNYDVVRQLIKAVNMARTFY